MIKVEVVRRVETAANWESWEFIDNPELKHIIEWVIGENLEGFVRRVLVNVCQAIEKDITEADNFVVRIFGGKPKAGWAYKRNRAIKRDLDNTCPDMTVAFANDPVEFEKTIIHEALHCLQWDEDAIEKKTQELYQNFSLNKEGENGQN